MNKTTHHILHTIAVLCGFLSGAVLAQTPNVQILAYGIHHGGQVIYRYQVRNNTASPISAVSLGVPTPGKELPGLPWSDDKTLTETPSEVSASKCKPFNQMACLVGVFQYDYMETPKTVIRMHGRELVQVPPPAVFAKTEHIAPNTTSSTAEILVPVRDRGYLNASGTVRFFSNFPKDAAGRPIVELELPFTKADLAAPVITGSASAVKRGGMLDVSVNLRVVDNLDPTPAVTLLSVTANEPLHPRDVEAALHTDARTLSLKRNKGRIYYLTYRATDGSENSSTSVIAVSGEAP